jgi:hydroxymethylpyrimidine/phosphomethylpyrimidine kinase
LFPLARLVTPNLDEAEVLLGRSIREIDDLDAAARDLLALNCQAVLLKGGHLNGPDVVDVLALRRADGSALLQHYRSPRIASRNLHGTGCTLSSAIACRLALGDDLPAAIEAARAYIMQAIEHGAQQQTGHGHGPLNHGFAPQTMQVFPRQ